MSVCIAGCTSSGSSFSGTPVEKYMPHPDVKTSLIDQDSDWSFSKGVYYGVTYQVYNVGDGAAKNVYLTIKLTRSGSNVVDDSKRIYVGTLQPGASTTVSADLDGDYDKEYNIHSSVSYD